MCVCVLCISTYIYIYILVIRLIRIFGSPKLQIGIYEITYATHIMTGENYTSLCLELCIYDKKTDSVDAIRKT